MTHIENIEKRLEEVVKKWIFLMLLFSMGNDFELVKKVNFVKNQILIDCLMDGKEVYHIWLLLWFLNMSYFSWFWSLECVECLIFERLWNIDSY
jgi:hypothetical protein